MIPQILGGIGLFLLGMILMTDGLKALAGDALRDALGRFAGGPLSSVASGAAVTALVQSSSATTLTTIGFVSAGLLTFPQALGVILGANVGTTSTGWLVSLLGLKLSVGAIAMPLVGVGAMARLLARDRMAAAGTALAGFGLVFVGIDALQAGMAVLADRIDPSAFPGATIAGRLLLILIGAAMTVIMQSSSAAVAATLTALHSGTIDLDQAAALVIGQSLGTTVTAGIAAIGASVPAKRTALAHVLFNVVTSLIALAILPAFIALVGLVAGDVGEANAAIVLAGFLTTYKLLGVILFLPVLGRFAAVVTRLIPDRGPDLTRHLDPSVAQVAPVAIEAVHRTLVDVAAVVLGAARALAARATHRRDELDQRLARAGEALEETARFLERLRSEQESAATHGRHLAVLHAIDHLSRLVAACGDPVQLSRLEEDPELRDAGDDLAAALARVEAWLADPAAPAPIDTVAATSASLASRRRTQREQTLERIARGEISPATANRQLELMRWLDRLGYYAWRALFHLGGGTNTSEPDPE